MARANLTTDLNNNINPYEYETILPWRQSQFGPVLLPHDIKQLFPSSKHEVIWPKDLIVWPMESMQQSYGAHRILIYREVLASPGGGDAIEA